MPRRGFYTAGLVVLLAAILFNTIIVLSDVEHVHRDEAALQAQRRETIREDCQEQNERNANTLRTLDGILSKAARQATPEARAQMAQTRAAVVLIVDDLAPVEDCARRVSKLAG